MNIRWNPHYFFQGEDTEVSNSLDEIVGETLDCVEGLEQDSEQVIFVTKSGKAIKLHHEQDCCECVDLNDFENDVENFDGAKVLSFEEVSCQEFETSYSDTQTWTFYKLETNRGGLWMRWLGESNGYYSENVDILGGVVVE